MNFRALMSAAAVAGMLATPLIATPAQAAPPAQALTKCGLDLTTATNEYYLDRDLTCSIGFRVVMGTGEDDDPVGRVVNIDLRGHRLRGTGTGTAISAVDYYQNVNVRNGTIEHWKDGLVSSSASVTNVQLLNNTGNAMGCGDGGCTATKSIIRGNVVGVWASDSTARITNTAVTGNRIGVQATGQFSEGYYSYSAFTGNKVAVRHSGFYIQMDAHHNVFTGNGVGLFREDDYGYGPTSIDRNTFIANGDGIYLATLEPEAEPDATISRNIALKNKRYGIYAPGATDGGGNKAAGNGKPCVGVVCTKP